MLNTFIFDYHLTQAARAVLQNQQQITMDVMTAVPSHSCLTDMGDLPHQTTPNNLVNQREDSLDSAMKLNVVIKGGCIYSIQEQSGEQLESVDDSELEPRSDVHTVTTHHTYSMWKTLSLGQL